MTPCDPEVPPVPEKPAAPNVARFPGYWLGSAGAEVRYWRYRALIAEEEVKKWRTST